MRNATEVPAWLERIFLPGPTPVPWPVAQAGARPMTDPRTDAFSALVATTRAALTRLAGTSGQAAVVPATGTGALEALCQNLFQPGDRVLAVVAGAFGKRFADVAEGQGLLVTRLEVPMGEAPDPDLVADRLASGTSSGAFRGLLITHNETSTGVLLPVDQIAARARAAVPNILCVVDSISGFPSIPLDMDANGIDAVAAASQKGFMVPPGLAILFLGPRALEAYRPDRPGRVYFDLGPFLKGQFPYTAPVSLWYALAESVRLLEEEGMDARARRHTTLGRMVRAAGAALGAVPRARNDLASPTVTALRVPGWTRPAALRSQTAQRGVLIAGAMGAWSEDTVRVGHVGALLPVDMMGAVAAIETALWTLADAAHVDPGFAPGDGVRAALLAMQTEEVVLR